MGRGRARLPHLELLEVASHVEATAADGTKLKTGHPGDTEGLSADLGSDRVSHRHGFASARRADVCKGGLSAFTLRPLGALPAAGRAAPPEVQGSCVGRAPLPGLPEAPGKCACVALRRWLSASAECWWAECRMPAPSPLGCQAFLQRPGGPGDVCVQCRLPAVFVEGSDEVFLTVLRPQSPVRGSRRFGGLCTGGRAPGSRVGLEGQREGGSWAVRLGDSRGAVLPGPHSLGQSPRGHSR